MTIQYDPRDFNELTVLLRWKGTVLPAVLCKPAIWLFLFVHFSFYYLHMYRADIHVPMMPWKLIIMPTSLLTFFLVFYSRNCFKRYYDLYKHCMLMSARVAEFAALLRIHFPKADADGQHGLFNMCRYPLASVYLLYFSLSGGGSDGGKVVTESEWRKLLQAGLLSEAEVKRLQIFQGFRPFVLHVWALRSLQDRLSKDPDKGPSAHYKPFEGILLKLNASCTEIVNTIAQPVPFPYYYTLTLMLSLNLMLMAYALVYFETVMTFPTFFVICVIALGLKETAVALADPFGGDDVDFETEVYMVNMLTTVRQQLSPAAEPPNVFMPLSLNGKEAIETAQAK